MLTAADLDTITFDVSHLTREQPALRIDSKTNTIDPRVRGFATATYYAMIAPIADRYYDGDPRPLADFQIGANFLARKRDGSIVIYKVTGRTVGSLLVSEVA